MNLGEKINELRKKNNLTQEKLADYLKEIPETREADAVMEIL